MTPDDLKKSTLETLEIIEMNRKNAKEKIRLVFMR